MFLSLPVVLLGVTSVASHLLLPRQNQTGVSLFPSNGQSCHLIIKQGSANNASGQLATSPPFYPSPWMTGQGEWAAAYAQARDFVSQMTLLEKVNLTTGVGWEGEQCVGQASTPS